MVTANLRIQSALNSFGSLSDCHYQMFELCHIF